MLKFMDRSTIYYLKRKGWTNTQIATFTGHHRDTIARVLREPVDRPPALRARPSAIACFDQKQQLVELLIDRLVVTNEEVEIRYIIPKWNSSSSGASGKRNRSDQLRNLIFVSKIWAQYTRTILTGAHRAAIAPRTPGVSVIRP